MAIRRHRLPRFWLALTLGLVGGAVLAAHWWETQLPGRLEQAARSGRIDDCLRFSEQLAALRWLGDRAPQEQGQCRRLKAESLWKAQKWREALRLQLQLVNSETGSPEDQQQLLAWQKQLQQAALTRYRKGDLSGALALLAPMNEDHRPDGSALGDSLKEEWARNRLQLERSRTLIAAKRWWEALDALNRIDQPWWKERSKALRQQVNAGLLTLKSKDEDHHSHEGALPSNVPLDQLDAAVRRHIAQGMDDFKAFKLGCRDLGGKVVESGPESACQR
ncbi:hypothetical protein [Cyanobium sp. Morenito 9A2]|uniref:hypothetical protein n=1 Tax=Cyanobium sp. Morenito 9A2 TaxID=2823718 RepID=UPI0020CF3FEF|nr:hypothetical protein [Cyanobium sp. Morenito 9A2]MCP9849115.1 hypothetical protein [Cyanobium sp. Morenito 9A2]